MADTRRKTLFKYVTPAVLAQVCFFVFTIVDGIFVGNGVGENGLGAVNLVMPFLMVVYALFMLISVGGSTITAIRFGRGDKAGANQAFMSSFMAILIVAAVLTVIGVFFSVPLGYFLGANETYIQYVSDYLVGYSIFLIPSAFDALFQFFGRNDGSPELAMKATVISSGINIFLDWLFIFPLGLGVKGAAVATGISQTIAFFIMLSHFTSKKGDLRFAKFRFDRILMQKIFIRGVPEAISQFSVSVSVICMNYAALERFGEIGVNSYSVIAYIASFSVAIFAGVAEGMQPVIGQSYGAKNTENLKYYYRLSVFISFIGSLAVCVGILFFGGYICRLFGIDSQTLAFATKAMPKYSLGFLAMSVTTIMSAYLYSTKRSKEAIILNIFRGIILNSVIIYFFPRIFGSEILWYAFVFYEGIGLLIGLGLIRASEKNGIIYR
ncbi:MAG: MATE family efflux transporter [Firmicutes bacterium]|nr:MATE family efflux transporter [Bacillota bacterium]